MTTSPTEPPRFAFGRNWRRFLAGVGPARIEAAEDAMRSLLGTDDLTGLRFLDIGSGSGLSSLAARNLGATVHSFDYDADSVACTRQVRETHRPGDAGWTVEQGSALDGEYLAALGRFDVVHAWGVLHHTGDLDRAMALVADRVAPGGRLWLAIYNDQGLPSRLWLAVKRTYCSGPIGAAAVCAAFFPYFVLRGLASDLIRARNPLARYREYYRDRGMSVTSDWVDWLGGLPFEVARPEDVFRFYRDRGFVLAELSTVGGSHGCNEFLFERIVSPA